MGKASSAKKVARAARAGGNRRPGQRRALGFPLLMGAILILGVSLVLFARSSREANAAPVSQASDPVNYDHWHAAIGFYQCDRFLFDGAEGGAALLDVGQDALGIHTHGDGVAHIHPFINSAGGRNARLALWFQQLSITVDDSKVTFPDGITVWDEATTQCGEGDDAGPGQIVIAKWNSAQDAADGEAPSEIFTEDFDSIRFRNDREYYTVAFLPEGQLENIPVRDRIMETLNNLSDVPASENIDAPDPTGDGASTTIGTDGTDTTGTSEPASATTTPTTAAPTTTTAG